MSNYVDSELENNSKRGHTHPVLLTCTLKNVTLIKSPITEVEYTLEPAELIDWSTSVADCVDNHTLIFRTDGSPNVRPTGTDALEVEEVVIGILCISSFPIIFEFEGFLPQWDTIVESDYNPESDIYLSTLYIPYMPDKTGNYSFSSSTGDGQEYIKRYEWFYIYFAGADNFVSNPWNTDQVMVWEFKELYPIVIPCRVTHPNLSQFVQVKDSKENKICSHCKISTKGVEIDDSVIMTRFKETDYLICIVVESNVTVTTKEIAKTSKRLKIRVLSQGTSWQTNLGGIRKINFKNEPHMVCLNNEEIQWNSISVVYVPRVTEIEIRKHCLHESNDCSSKLGTPLYGANKNTENCETGETCSISIDQDFEPTGSVRCVTQFGNVTTEVDYFTGLDNKIYFVHDWDLGLVPSKALATISTLLIGRIYCSVSNYLYMPGFKFKLVFLNGTIVVKSSEAAISISRFGKIHKFGQLHSGSNKHSEWLDGIELGNLKTVSCIAQARKLQLGKRQWIEVFLEGGRDNKSIPHVFMFAVTKIPHIGEHILFFNCSAIGVPKPEIRYEKDDKKITGLTMDVVWNSTENVLHSSGFVQRTAQNVYGVYRCVAKNNFGVHSQVVEYDEKHALKAQKCNASPHQEILDAANIIDQSSVKCSERASLSCHCTCPTQKKTPNCRCPVPIYLSTEEEYFLWPTFFTGGVSIMTDPQKICYLSGHIDCSDSKSEQCNTTLTSDIKGSRSNQAFTVGKKQIKPLPTEISANDNTTDTRRVCSIQRTVSDTLCLLDPKKEIHQTAFGSGLQLLFELKFEDLICECNVLVKEGPMHTPANELVSSTNDTLTFGWNPWSGLVLVLVLVITICVLVFGWVMCKRHARNASLQNSSPHNKIVSSGSQSSHADNSSPPVSPLQVAPPTERSIWISPQPLQLLSPIPLGAGYYGKVYKALHLVLNEPMAVKHILLYKALQACSWNVELLLREIKHLRQVEHTNVVKFYHCWIEGPEGMVGLVESMEISQWTSTNDNFSFFIQMEFCDSTLDIWLKEHPTGEERSGDKDITSIFRQILQGLDAIHRKDIVHRDIKPNNIFWKEEGGKKIWKVGDLGLSRKMGSSGPEGESGDDDLSHVGNINYRSPEMSRELNYNYKTDIYSLGLVFLEILLPEVILTGKKVQVFTNLRDLENLESYLTLILEPGLNQIYTAQKHKLVYEILEGMLNSVPDLRSDIQDTLGLLGKLEMS